MASVGFVSTSNKDVFFIIRILEAAINSVIGDTFSIIRDNRAAGRTVGKRVEVSLEAASKYVRLLFTHDGEEQVMWVFFNDNTYKEHAPSSIVVNMENTGNRSNIRLYLDTALRALSCLGPVFYIPDTDAEPVAVKEANVQRLCFLEAVERRWAYPFELEGWVTQYRAEKLREGDAEDVFGFPVAELNKLVGMAAEELKAALKGMLGGLLPLEDA
jgi:hypothetical protein